MDKSKAENLLAYCFYLANLGRGLVSPNPKVGALLFYKDRIIGEGFHQKFGENHAEVNAIESVKHEDKHLIEQSTLVVSLEPCNHQGKTGPCTEFILKNKIAKVVFSAFDPNPIMAGKSIAFLKQHGVETIGPLLESKGQNLIREFRCNILEKRPFVILKVAQSGDFLMGREHEQTKISSYASDMLVHRWRTESDAIVVGKNTVFIDNPQLTSRYWAGKNPIRIVLGQFSSAVRSDFHIFNKEAPTYDLVDLGLNNKEPIEELLNKLFQMQIGIVLVEGGPKTLRLIYESGLWDEARIITNSGLKLGKGILAPCIQGFLREKVTLDKDIIHYIAKNKEY